MPTELAPPPNDAFAAETAAGDVSDAAAPETAASELTRLQEQLGEKNELVSMLTDRLEQAVERLDRLKREGAKPQPSGSPAGMELERLIGEWDQADLGSLGTRIEDQFADLRAYLRDELAAVAVAAPAIEPAAAAAEPSGDASSWERMKAALMDGEEPLAVPSGSASPAPAAEPAEPAEPEVLEVPEQPIASPLPSQADVADPDPLPAGPAAFDIDAADRDELAEAVRLRDAYIIALSQRALDRRIQLEVPTDWALLRGVPGELVKSVQRLHDQLDDAVRMAEVQLCLERAKLSRERTEIDQLRAELDKPEQPSDEPEETPRDRRWRRMLGRS